MSFKVSYVIEVEDSPGVWSEIGKPLHVLSDAISKGKFLAADRGQTVRIQRVTVCNAKLLTISKNENQTDFS